MGVPDVEVETGCEAVDADVACVRRYAATALPGLALSKHGQKATCDV